MLSLISSPLAATGFIDAAVMDPTPLQILWFMIIGVLLLGYFVLDGFDLGTGALYPFIAKTDTEKAMVRRSVGPLWDGNEVWLLSGGGALFAAFAPAYATSFSGFYLAIMLVLFGLIARAAAIEFRSLERSLGGFFDAAFFLGSAVPALLFGVAVGNVVQGIPLDVNGDYAGLPLVGLLRPFPLACGLVGLSTMLLQGASWQSLKQPLESEVRARAVRLRRVLLILTLVLFALASVLYFLLVSPVVDFGTFGGILAIIAAALFVVGVIAAFVAQGNGMPATNPVTAKSQDVMSFVAANILPVSLIILTAATLFPYLIPSTGPGPSISVASAGGSELALTVMTIIACIGVPLVLIYHVMVYRTFRGRVTEDEALEY
ncbi:MAG: cytochrome d ubiquinol oxidase subunit II [Coriobacteriales bacterium]|jgi:cytochrome d ubiquinol oxidase subunit II|nr:cytochrome d ubiquinol oxidase subunit II [Coriobacteriales bacterium]